MLIVVFIVVLAGAALQGGVTFKKFKLDFEHFNLLSGLKRVFGTQALWDGVKALLKASRGGPGPLQRRAGADAGAADGRRLPVSGRACRPRAAASPR